MERKYLLLLLMNLWCGGVFAQMAADLFLPLTWEQASAMAARENKLVLVEVGDVGREVRETVRKHRELTDFLQRQTVAIRMDMNTPQGKAFESRLLLYSYPLYAFFMPYGDLVGIVMADEVKDKPGCLREVLEEAKAMAQEKRRNSRSVKFMEERLEDVLARTAGKKQNLFVYVADRTQQASWLMEKNVFTLDRVADFYNRNFYNVYLNVQADASWIRKFGVKETPAFIFLNGEGKLLLQADGYSDAERLLALGAKALEKARGIPFESWTDEQAREEARPKGKFIFTDCYVEGRKHQELVEGIFADPEVTDFFMKHFVNVAREGKQDVLLFATPDGQEVHRVLEIRDVSELLNEAKRALAGEGVAGMTVRYRAGERDAGFVEEYMAVLARAGMTKEASEVAVEYLAAYKPEVLKEKKYWDLFNRYVHTAQPAYFDYVLSCREELAAWYGEKEVREKTVALCMAGAEGFVTEGQFDEEGFKQYAKRLKKEKVEGWRQIIRNARMDAAERVEDWKTYILLVEEKWHEEEIADVELYRLAQKIEMKCQDGNVRYKMAQWLTQRVLEINRKEYLTGKVDLTSYRGFFEKMADDLLKGVK